MNNDDPDLITVRSIQYLIDSRISPVLDILSAFNVPVESDDRGQLFVSRSMFGRQLRTIADGLGKS